MWSCGGQGRADIGAGEIVADIEEGTVELFGGGVGKAVAEIERCGVEALAEALVGCGASSARDDVTSMILKSSEVIRRNNPSEHFFWSATIFNSSKVPADNSRGLSETSKTAAHLAAVGSFLTIAIKADVSTAITPEGRSRHTENHDFYQPLAPQGHGEVPSPLCLG